MDYSKVIRERRPKLRDNSVTAYALSLKSMAPPDNKDMDYLYAARPNVRALHAVRPWRPAPLVTMEPLPFPAKEHNLFDCR